MVSCIRRSIAEYDGPSSRLTLLCAGVREWVFVRAGLVQVELKLKNLQVLCLLSMCHLEPVVVQ